MLLRQQNQLPVQVVVTGLVIVIVTRCHMVVIAMLHHLGRVVVVMARVVPILMRLDKSVSTVSTVSRRHVGLAEPAVSTVSTITTVSAATRLDVTSEQSQSRDDGTKRDEFPHDDLLRKCCVAVVKRLVSQ